MTGCDNSWRERRRRSNRGNRCALCVGPATAHHLVDSCRQHGSHCGTHHVDPVAGYCRAVLNKPNLDALFLLHVRARGVQVETADQPEPDSLRRTGQPPATRRPPRRTCNGRDGQRPDGCRGAAGRSGEAAPAATLPGGVRLARRGSPALGWAARVKLAIQRRVRMPRSLTFGSLFFTA